MGFAYTASKKSIRTDSVPPPSSLWSPKNQVIWAGGLEPVLRQTTSDSRPTTNWSTLFTILTVTGATENGEKSKCKICILLLNCMFVPKIYIGTYMFKKSYYWWGSKIAIKKWKSWHFAASLSSKFQGVRFFTNFLFGTKRTITSDVHIVRKLNLILQIKCKYLKTTFNFT